MPESSGVGSIYVLAGTNGAGKSSIAGAEFRQRGGDYFNPDEAARRILNRNPRVTQAQANSAAWLEGKRLLERAIREKLNFALETTLGGGTITSLLTSALEAGIEVRIWFVGLASPELHIARVRARVAQGGHDIPDSKIRERYQQSRVNLIHLMPALTELRVYDNSKEADPATGAVPKPKLLLHMKRRRMVTSCKLTDVPEWAKPILAAAVKIAVSIHRDRRARR